MLNFLPCFLLVSTGSPVGESYSSSWMTLNVITFQSISHQIKNGQIGCGLPVSDEEPRAESRGDAAEPKDVSVSAN